MKYYYSPLRDSFFPGDLKKQYVSANNWPNDAIESSFEDFLSFSLNAAPTGKKRAYRDGRLVWESVQSPVKDPAETERLWRNLELQRSDIEVFKAQDSDPKTVGSVSDWRKYRKALRAWPESTKFPDREFRPQSPDFKE